MIDKTTLKAKVRERVRLACLYYGFARKAAADCFASDDEVELWREAGDVERLAAKRELRTLAVLSH